MFLLLQLRFYGRWHCWTGNQDYLLVRRNLVDAVIWGHLRTSELNNLSTRGGCETLSAVRYEDFSDYTLWPFWVDTHVRSPIRKDKNNHIVDGYGEKIKPYQDVPEVLEELKNDGYTLGIASRTEWPDGARQLLKLFDWNKYFTYQEIYPGRKTTHFQRLHGSSGIEYSDMMFFDDEPRNISDLKAIGVTSILVPDGVNKQIIREALASFKKK